MSSAPSAARQALPGTSSRRRTTWAPLAIDDLLRAGVNPPEPSIGRLTDELGIFYPGKTHSIASEPEAGKTWFALSQAQHEIERGSTVMYIDFEDDGATICARLQQLGVLPDQLKQQFLYINPEEPISETARADLFDAIDQARPSLVIIDGVTEAMTMEGLSLTDNQAAAAFYERFPRPIARRGPAVVLLDHEVKRREDRGAYALGAGHKLAAISGAAFRLEVERPMGRGQSGSSLLQLTKDRNGCLRSHAEGSGRVQHLGIFLLESEADGPVSTSLITGVQIDSARRKNDELKVRITEFLLESEDITTKAAIKRGVRGNSQATTDAIRELIEGGFITSTPPYRVLIPYPSMPESTVVALVDSPVVPVPPLEGGTTERIRDDE